MTLQQYELIKLLYDGLVSIEFSENPNLKIGDIYYHSPKIKSIVRKVDFYKDYCGKQHAIITQLI